MRVEDRDPRGDGAQGGRAVEPGLEVEAGRVALEVLLHQAHDLVGAGDEARHLLGQRGGQAHHVALRLRDLGLARLVQVVE